MKQVFLAEWVFIDPCSSLVSAVLAMLSIEEISKITPILLNETKLWPIKTGAE
jgi:hypothetical protein